MHIKKYLLHNAKSYKQSKPWVMSSQNSNPIKLIILNKTKLKRKTSYSLLSSYFSPHILVVFTTRSYLAFNWPSCPTLGFFHFLLTGLLTLSWRRPLSHRNQSIDLRKKPMDWFLYDNGLRHERVKPLYKSWKRSGLNSLNKLNFPPSQDMFKVNYVGKKYISEHINIIL